MTKSEQMSRVRSRDTQPELLVRSLLSAHGIRYRLHRKDLPGCPDIYIGRLKVAIFVNGCYWHGHSCKRGERPKTNTQFWDAKISRNVERDKRSLAALNNMGIAATIFWTCEKSQFARRCANLGRRYSRHHAKGAASKVV